MPASRPAALAVRVTPTAPRQGDIAFVLVTGVPSAREVEGSLDGKPLAFFPYGEDWAAVIGIDLETPHRQGAVAGGRDRRGGDGPEEDGHRHHPRAHLPGAAPDLARPHGGPGPRVRAARECGVGPAPHPLRHGDRGAALAGALHASGRGGGPRLGLRLAADHQWQAAECPTRGRTGRPSAGTPVVAANRGRVALVGDFFFGGRLVVLDHGLGLYTLYMHLDRVDVAEGAFIGRGETPRARWAPPAAPPARICTSRCRPRRSRVDPGDALRAPRPGLTPHPALSPQGRGFERPRWRWPDRTVTAVPPTRTRGVALPAPSTLDLQASRPAHDVALLGGEGRAPPLEREHARLREPEGEGRMHGAGHDVLGDAVVRGEEAAVASRSRLHRLARDHAGAAQTMRRGERGERVHVGPEGV